MVLPPALLLGDRAAGRARRRTRPARARTWCSSAGWSPLIVVQALKKAIDASDAVLIVLSLAIGAAVAALYARAEPVRSFLSVLTPAPLVFLVLFLFARPCRSSRSRTRRSAHGRRRRAQAPMVMRAARRAPVEHAGRRDGEIDAERYPGFGELARSATWFQNAHTIYDSTERALPAIMDGNLPAKDRLPTSSEHPNSIFSLLGKSHRMNVSEEATTRLPARPLQGRPPRRAVRGPLTSMTEDLGLVWLHVVSPPGIEEDLTSVSENWGDFGGASGRAPDRGSTGAERQHPREPGRRPQRRFEEWIDQIQPGRRPTLNFKHTLLPHVPWQYLPDGRRYRAPGQRGDPRALAPVLQRPGPAGRAAPAPLPADRLRRPRARRSCGPPQAARASGTTR